MLLRNYQKNKIFARYNLLACTFALHLKCIMFSTINRPLEKNSLKPCEASFQKKNDPICLYKKSSSKKDLIPCEVAFHEKIKTQ